MALELNDLMALKSLDGGMSPYEQMKISHMEGKRPNGAATTGIVLGSVGTALAIGAWIFGPMFAKARAAQAREAANAAKDVAIAKTDGLRDLLTMMGTNLAAERAERIAGDVTISQTQSDTQTGSQAAALTAQQAAELSSIQSVQQNLLNQAIMGNLSENPQKVQIYSAPVPCGCPNSCGCNG